MLCIFHFSKLYTFLDIKEKLIQIFPLTYIGPLWHHNRVIKLACTCASLTPAPRFQGSSSLCPSPFNCITRNIKRHLPYSPFFSLHLSLYPFHIYFLSHSISLPHSIVSPSFNIYPLHSLFTAFIQSHSCSLFFSSFFLSSTLLSFFLSFFYSSCLLPLFFPFFTLLSFLLSFFHSSFFSSSFLNFCISCTGISFRKCIF